VTDADGGEPDDQHGGSDHDCSGTRARYGGRTHFA
jgi:hypothetical protein